jgi:hypothetical protein
MNHCDRRRKPDAWRGCVSGWVGERDYGLFIPHAHRIILSRVSGGWMQGGGEQGNGDESGAAPLHPRCAQATV